MIGRIAAKFAGTWRLLSLTSRTSDGQIVYPFGRNAQGRATIAPGYFSAQLMDPDRPSFPSGDPRLASDAEVRAAFEAYLAYYGSMSIHPEEATLVTCVEAASVPSWVGTDQVRTYRFDGDHLVLSTPPIAYQGVEMSSTLVWERLT
jgi:hypothetical protein